MAKTTHDGSDFKHRQRVLPQYHSMVLSKKRLKFTIILHLLLGFLMAAKLLPSVLDLLNIFWQPIEELEIPMARSWEWVWLAALLQAAITLRAMKTNNVFQLQFFLVVTVACSIFPLIYCAYLYSADFRAYVITKDPLKTSEVWRNYPVGLYWYIFISVACQVHGFELYFGMELLRSMNNHRPMNKTK